VDADGGVEAQRRSGGGFGRQPSLVGEIGMDPVESRPAINTPARTCSIAGQ
jgi:hypothetical protein